MIQPPSLFVGPSDLLVLLVLRRARLHVWGIVRRVQELSGDSVQLDERLVDRSLRRLEGQGWVDVDSGPPNGDATRRVYRLTRLGRQEFKRIKSEYDRMATGIARLLRRA